MLSCTRYIELNPVRASMVNHPVDYPWSSYRTNAQGEPSGLVETHGLYNRLAEELSGCQLVYRELFCYALEPGFVDQVRQATNGNVVLGNDRFGEEIVKMLGKRITHGNAGRPRKMVKR